MATLLDMFAMSAMNAMIVKTPSGAHDDADEYLEEPNSIQNWISRGAYDYAAAMMQERDRRDENGNIKESTNE